MDIRCKKCGETKEPKEFYRDKRKKNGKMSYCKDCHDSMTRENARKWHEQNKELVKERNKRWKQNNPEKVKEHNQRHREKNRG